MTRRDNIIFYTITAVVFLGIIFCFFWSRTSEVGSVPEKLSPYAALISSVAALISAGAALYIGTRKTRQNRIDELKTEMRIYVSNKHGFKMYPKDVEPMFRSLPNKYQEPIYKELHRAAYHELRLEGRLEHIFDLPAASKQTK